jgi:hypothetical protein
MPTLDNRGVAVKGTSGLKINYSSLYPVSEIEMQKLAQSFNLARAVIDGACARVNKLLMYEKNKETLADPWKTAPEGKISHDMHQALRYHFKFEELTSKEVQYKVFVLEWSEWRDDLTKILEKMEQIRGGLWGEVTISDYRSKGIKSALRHNNRALMNAIEWQVISKWHEFEPKNDQDLAYYVSQAMEYEGKKKPLSSELRELADNLQPSNRGSVSVSTKKWDSMSREDKARFKANDPSLELSLEDRKNIKLDFRLLAMGSEPALRIAGTIVHEASHRYANTRDCAYAHDEGAYRPLSKFHAMNNADSFALAAICLYKDRCFENYDVMRRESFNGVDLNS